MLSIMRDWEAMAKARGLQVPGRELDLVTGPLRALEEVFRPLAADLPPGLEPATTFRADPEENQ
jgi:hypothetical protein